MRLAIRCKSGRRIVVDDIEDLAVTVNKGLIIGIGANGLSTGITPQDVPTLFSSFKWEEFLKRLLTDDR